MNTCNRPFGSASVSRVLLLGAAKALWPLPDQPSACSGWANAPINAKMVS
jgi:hypothetical protein